MAEFEDPNHLVAAAHRAREAGYRRMDAYSPLPIEELHEAIGFHDTKLPMIVLIGGLVGCLAGYLLQYWVSTMPTFQGLVNEEGLLELIEYVKSLKQDNPNAQ